MSQIFQKHIELATLTDSASPPQTTVGTPYVYNNAYVPTVGCQIVRGVNSSTALATILLALKNPNVPISGYELIVINNLSTSVQIQVNNAQLSPLPAAVANITIPIIGYGYGFLPGEWMSTNTTFSSSTGTFNVDLIYWT